MRVRRTARATWRARSTAGFAALARFFGTLTTADSRGRSLSPAVRVFWVVYTNAARPTPSATAWTCSAVSTGRETTADEARPCSARTAAPAARRRFSSCSRPWPSPRPVKTTRPARTSSGAGTTTTFSREPEACARSASCARRRRTPAFTSLGTETVPSWRTPSTSASVAESPRGLVAAVRLTSWVVRISCAVVTVMSFHAWLRTVGAAVQVAAGPGAMRRCDTDPSHPAADAGAGIPCDPGGVPCPSRARAVVCGCAAARVH